MPGYLLVNWKPRWGLLMKKELKSAFQKEMRLAHSSYLADDLDQAFSHFERAHILGQRYFIAHMVTHWWMFRVGIRRQDLREIFGQITRMIRFYEIRDF